MADIKRLASEAEKFLRNIVAGALEDYGPRQSPVDMLRACYRHFEHGGTLLARAGTGTGKTFALSGTFACLR